MNKAEYNWPIPRVLGREWREFRKALGPAAQERGQAQRYFLERRGPGDAADQLRTHHMAPLEACSCYICNGGPKRAFKMSGDTMSQPIQDATDVGTPMRRMSVNPLIKDMSRSWRSRVGRYD